MEAGVAYGSVAYDEVDSARRRPRRRWGRRLLTVFLVLLLVLLGLAVVADRVFAGVAEDRISEQVSKEMAARDVSSSAPEVSVGGFPFLTQVLRGRYESISILLRDVSGEGVKVSKVDAEATNVTAPLDTITSGNGDILAETVRGTATVEYASVAQLIKQPDLRLAEKNGRLVASLPVDLLGQRFTLTGEAELKAVKGKVQLRFSELSAEGMPAAEAVRNLVSGYARQLSIDIALPELPFALELQDVKALPEGLSVTGTARDVPLNRAP
jgi:LmeA-like phospholipid-binding